MRLIAAEWACRGVVQLDWLLQVGCVVTSAVLSSQLSRLTHTQKRNNHMKNENVTRFVPYPFVSFPVLSCRTLSYPILSNPVLFPPALLVASLFARYLSQQIVPPVSRLCEPIEGTSMAILAEKMGLDVSKFTSHVSMYIANRSFAGYPRPTFCWQQGRSVTSCNLQPAIPLYPCEFTESESSIMREGGCGFPGVLQVSVCVVRPLYV